MTIYVGNSVGIVYLLYLLWFYLFHLYPRPVWHSTFTLLECLSYDLICALLNPKNSRIIWACLFLISALRRAWLFYPFSCMYISTILSYLLQSALLWPTL